jgi:hypothetical protein
VPGDVVQVVEHLVSKCKVPSLTPNTAKRKTKKWLIQVTPFLINQVDISLLAIKL